MLNKQMEELDLCIYHANCSDGFGAAWSTWMHYGDDNTEYLPAAYDGTPDEQFWIEKVRGRKVLVFDFCFPRELTEKLHAEAEYFQVIDHHKTAQENMDGLDYCTFDLDHSGARLAWEALHATPTPELVKYVEDADLLRYALQDSKQINTYINARPRKFDVWFELCQNLETREGRIKAAVDGAWMLRYEGNLVKEIIEKQEVWEIMGYEVPVVNTTCFQNQAVGKMARGNHFAASYFVRGGVAVWSLRSGKDGVDVGEVGRYFGGGGHPTSAGFNIPTDRIDFNKKKLV